MKYSIVIPTYNHCDDLLKPCLESIINYTSLNDIEIIVVANGCTDNTKEFLKNYPYPINVVWMDAPAGYTKSTNEGIKLAQGEFVILLNNDIILLSQEKNSWIETLVKPFNKDPKVAVTGPVKFSWDCGGVTREAMAFWCVMIRKSIFNQIGILDEIFSPGMGEDGDFCIRAVKAGYKIVSVPEDIVGEFDTGIKNFNFPIWHKGNGTFADKNVEKNEVIERNKNILEIRYGAKKLINENSNVGKWTWYNGVENKIPYGDNLTYKLGAEFLYDCQSIEDWGCGMCYFSNFLSPTVNYIGIDGSHSKFVSEVHDLVTYRSKEKPDGIFMRHILEHNYDWKPILQNALASFKNKFVLVLFTPINTNLTREIAYNQEIGVPDISFNMYEILDLLKEYKFNFKEYVTSTQYGIEHIFYIEHQVKQPDITIVIPTYNHLEDALKPCLNALFKYTDLSNKEVIVVANGCNDGTELFLKSLNNIRVFNVLNPAGYIKSVNYGIYASNSKYVITLDNDSTLLNERIDHWINVLLKPFLEMENVGATSPFASDYDELGLVLHSGCTMYSTEALKKIGCFDEIYNPGYFSDSDVSLKLSTNGYQTLEVPVYNPNKLYQEGVFKVQFPVMHLGNIQTMDKNKDEIMVRRNKEILYNRYGKNKNMNPKFSIIIPTYNHCDDLLKPCVESIFQFTELSNVEIIVVANGCTDNTREYLNSVSDKVKTIWSDEPLGYTKATNLGIKASLGEFVILLNNDTLLLDQSKNLWIEMLHNPFQDPKIGLTGPLQLYDYYADAPVLIFFCVMIRREVFDKIGYLDEIFSPGGGEDIDFTVRARAAGFEAIPIVNTVYNGDTNVGDFPIWHKDNRTFKEIPEYTNYIIKRNGLINCKRYNKNIKLNLGAGGVNYPGYLSVDLYDKRADVLMDITKLDFEENSVTEILGSHVFEHLNPYHVWDTLHAWKRVLKPGGRLILEMPNIEELCKRFVTASKSERYGILNAVYGSVNTTNEGTPDQITSPHLFGWWPEAMWDYLVGVGFENIVIGPEQIPHPEANFRVEATKPLTSIKNVPRVNRESLRSQEPMTYKEIFEDNSYGLSEEDIKSKTVIDVGANLGMFSLRCVELGVDKVVCIEAQKQVYYGGLLPNIREYYDIIKPMFGAVLDVDGKEVKIMNAHVASRVTNGEGDPTTTLTLETILKANALDNRNDLVLKLDCEGSEYPIVLNGNIETFRKFETIFMELHDNVNEDERYRNSQIVRDKLVEFGFKNVFINEMLWFEYNENGIPVKQQTIGVYVEKWIRN